MELTTQLQARMAWIIVVLFFAFAFFVAYSAIGTQDAAWSRLYAVFSSIEALGFAAAGVILGRRIDAPQVAQMRKLETDNAALAAQQHQNEAALASLEQEIETARKALADTSVPTEELRGTEQPLERALLRIGATRPPASRVRTEQTL